MIEQRIIRPVWPVVGHEWAIEILARSVTSGRMSHAYLFSGPPQIGKTTMAQAFAQAVNCVGAEPPCGVCSSCRRIAAGIHPDVRVVRAEGTSIKIDQIRELQREAALSPVEGRWRVYIVRQMELATTEAANCLLKTLEEPPARVILILTTSDQDALLPTIVSRCQIFTMHPLPIEKVRAVLSERGIDDGRARLLARLSMGRLGWAINAASDPASLDQRQQRLDEMAVLFGQGWVERFNYAAELSGNLDEARRAMDLWLSWWRDLLLLASGSAVEITNLDRRTELEEATRRYSLDEVYSTIIALRQAIWQLEHNANARLVLENLMLHWPDAHASSKYIVLTRL
jgi:DNA polymerase-3 subunit delta'